MTEEEARETWCGGPPQVAYAISNRGTSREGERYCCIASDCMMFRFLPDATYTLTNGMVVIVDERDNDLITHGGWWWAGRYVKNKNGYLHRAVITKHFGEIPPGFVIDHKDGNPLNNRLGNLRICEQRENCLNSKGRGGKSCFKGVFQNKQGRWSAQISNRGIRKCLGTYDTEEEAAKAYDKAARQRFDEFSRLNFESPVSDGRQGFCGLANKP